VTNYTSFGIVVEVNQAAQTIISRRAVTIILFVLALVTINFPSAIKKSTPEMRPCLHLANEFLFYILLNDLLEQSKNWSIHGLVRFSVQAVQSSLVQLPLHTQVAKNASSSIELSFQLVAKPIEQKKQ
jgi:hypothetical protein